MISTVAYASFRCSKEQDPTKGLERLLCLPWIDLVLGIIFSVIGILAACGILPNAVGIVFFSLAFIQVAIGGGCIKARSTIEKDIKILRQNQADLERLKTELNKNR